MPLAGTTIKLAPDADKLEIRVSGPNVTPGYFKAPQLTAAAFDDEGFYRSGDAVKLVDEHEPNQGLLFDGRIAEDFKLLTGTWVTVGPLRTRLLGAARVLTDAVICGHDKEYVAALAWVNQAEARKLLRHRRRRRARRSTAAPAPGADARHARCDGRVGWRASSACCFWREPPSLDAGEITDKGYLNQRRAWRCRAADVARLYAAEPDPDVITPADDGERQPRP